jgi:hypothetical protein
MWWIGLRQCINKWRSSDDTSFVRKLRAFLCLWIHFELFSTNFFFDEWMSKLVVWLLIINKFWVNYISLPNKRSYYIFVFYYVKIYIFFLSYVKIVEKTNILIKISNFFFKKENIFENIIELRYSLLFRTFYFYNNQLFYKLQSFGEHTLVRFNIMKNLMHILFLSIFLIHNIINIFWQYIFKTYYKLWNI